MNIRQINKVEIFSYLTFFIVILFTTRCTTKNNEKDANTELWYTVDKNGKDSLYRKRIWRDYEKQIMFSDTKYGNIGHTETIYNLEGMVDEISFYTPDDTLFMKQEYDEYNNPIKSVSWSLGKVDSSALFFINILNKKNKPDTIYAIEIDDTIQTKVIKYYDGKTVSYDRINDSFMVVNRTYYNENQKNICQIDFDYDRNIVDSLIYTYNNNGKLEMRQQFLNNIPNEKTIFEYDKGKLKSIKVILEGAENEKSYRIDYTNTNIDIK